MKKSTYFIASLLLLLFTTKSYNQKTAHNWDNYIASYEAGNLGSTTLRMDLINKAPVKEMPFVLMIGISYFTSRADGFPESETFKMLHAVGNGLEQLITLETDAVLAGSFMYQQERIEYFYIKDYEGLKEKIAHYFLENKINLPYYIHIAEDREWDHYKKFLYPNEATLRSMAEKVLVKNLQEAEQTAPLGEGK